MDDKFSVAFEFYINVGHAVVERAGVSQAFAELVWKQVQARAQGETSLDAWESRQAGDRCQAGCGEVQERIFCGQRLPTRSRFICCLCL